VLLLLEGERHDNRSGERRARHPHDGGHARFYRPLTAVRVSERLSGLLGKQSVVDHVCGCLDCSCCTRDIRWWPKGGDYGCSRRNCGGNITVHWPDDLGQPSAICIEQKQK